MSPSLTQFPEWYEASYGCAAVVVVSVHNGFGVYGPVLPWLGATFDRIVLRGPGYPMVTVMASVPFRIDSDWPAAITMKDTCANSQFFSSFRIVEICANEAVEGRSSLRYNASYRCTASVVLSNPHDLLRLGATIDYIDPHVYCGIWQNKIRRVKHAQVAFALYCR